MFCPSGHCLAMEHLVDGRLYQPHGHAVTEAARSLAFKHACVSISKLGGGACACLMMSTTHTNSALPAALPRQHILRPRCRGAAAAPRARRYAQARAARAAPCPYACVGVPLHARCARDVP